VPFDDVHSLVLVKGKIEGLRGFLGSHVPKTTRQVGAVALTGAANPLNLAKFKWLVLGRVKNIANAKSRIGGHGLSFEVKFLDEVKTVVQ
jgi:hypothetical protein